MAGPRIDLDANGFPVFIDVVPDDALRLIKPTGDDIDLIHDYRRIYGLEDPKVVKDFQQQYLQRFDLDPSNPRYADALAELATESNSKKVAVAQARRVAQQTETIQALRGNIGGTCVYITDGPEPCERCLALSGLEKPYNQMIADGEAPGDQCLGGDNCMCIPVPIN